MIDIETEIVEGNAKDKIIKHDTAESIDSNPELQSGAEELIIIEDTDTFD